MLNRPAIQSDFDPWFAARVGGRLRIVAGLAEGLQVRGIVGAALGLRDDVIDLVGRSHNVFVKADLAQVIISVEDMTAQLVPCIAVTASVSGSSGPCHLRSPKTTKRPQASLLRAQF